MHEVFDEFKRQLPDVDPQETEEWIESLDALVKQAGPERARFVLYKLLKRARMLQVGLPPLTQTRYINTISPEQEPDFPGDEEMEHRIRQFIRWNAVAMVVRANHHYEASAATWRRTRRRRRCMRSASTTSSRARTIRPAATRSSSKDTPLPASTPAPTSKGG